LGERGLAVENDSDFFQGEIIFEIKVDDLGVKLLFGEDGEVLMESELLEFIGKVLD
jgi:hypothetical protein